MATGAIHGIQGLMVFSQKKQEFFLASPATGPGMPWRTFDVVQSGIDPIAFPPLQESSKVCHGFINPGFFE
jgi:hypothetical protein